MLDERWIRALHVETMRERELHAEREHHVLFQASTIGALLDGAYDGDLSFAELAEHGDLGAGGLVQVERTRPRGSCRGGIPHVLGSRFAVSSAMGDPRHRVTRGRVALAGRRGSVGCASAAGGSPAATGPAA